MDELRNAFSGPVRERLFFTGTTIIEDADERRYL